MEKKKKFSYKDLKVNEEELSITKIGEMPNENKSPIFLVFVFGFLIVFVFFLPELVSYFGKKDSTTTNQVVENNKENPEDENEEEIIYYDIQDSLEVNLENKIKINQFKLQNNSLSFLVTNTQESTFDFSKKNYFLEFYTEDKTLLERVILVKESIPRTSNKEYTYSLMAQTSSNAKKLAFVEKQVEDYPNMSLTKNENGEQVFECVKDYESITYTFKEDKLQKITDVVNYTRGGNEINYQLELASWQSKVANYNTIAGITSSFMSNETGFMVNTVLDLPNVKISSVTNDAFYKYETLAKVVSFEMQARGFSCK